jgi:hypothetical protein
MSNEAATLNASTWQYLISTLASLCACLRTRPRSKQRIPHKRELGPLLNAWEDEPPEVKRFVASQIARGWWI